MSDNENKPKPKTFYEQYEVEQYLKRYCDCDASEFFDQVYQHNAWAHDRLGLVEVREMYWLKDQPELQKVGEVVRAEFGEEFHMKAS